ncbi:MAG: hypothetical protein NTY53_26090 [Kiritimatiellaeota bacterium]|nr:hypothetical protein [Kiritimatiellota bacterium]
MKLENVLERLGDVRQTTSGYKANCPLHGDDGQHLTISEASGKILLKCFHSNCKVSDICAAIGLEVKDLFNNDGKQIGGGFTLSATYDYKDANGATVYQVVRYTPKTFRQRRPDGAGSWIYKMTGVETIPFHLPELIRAAGDKRTVYICEGEKDVLNVEAMGLAATCNTGGAGKFKAAYSKYFTGCPVVIIADKDDAGRIHAADVAKHLFQSASVIKILELPDINGAQVKDASDWIQAGGTVEALEALTAAQPAYQPPRSLLDAPPLVQATTTAPTAEGATLGKPDDTEAFYYDAARKEYMVKSSRGIWLCLTEAQFKKELARRGFRTKTNDDGLSVADSVIMEVRDKNDIAYAGALAGYKAGFYSDGANRFLVTEGPKLIEPMAGQWSTLEKFIAGLLHEDGFNQETFLYGWLKVSYEALRAGCLRPAQALAIAGPHGCGKSLLQKVITEILGGRFARPYQFMAGLTPFNADLFGAEHLMLEDEQSSYDIRTRRNFGCEIKNITVNDAQRCHAKNRQAVPLKPFWRLSMTLNDETENLMQLPPMDDSLEDKLIILRAHTSAMPMPTATLEQRHAFWGALVAELPAFLDYLLKMEIPADMTSERFGVTHFHHPAILEEISALSPEAKLLTLIDTALFSAPVKLDWLGTAEELEKILTNKDSGTDYEARRLLAWNTACGVYLQRLAKKYPERFAQRRDKSSRRWFIKAPTSDGDGTGGDGGGDGVSGCLSVQDSGDSVTLSGCTLSGDGVSGCSPFLLKKDFKKNVEAPCTGASGDNLAVPQSVSCEILRHPVTANDAGAVVGGKVDDLWG